MSAVNLLLVLTVCVLAIAAWTMPPATATCFACVAYLAGRSLTRRLP